MDKCNATFEFANGHVATCDLEDGHVFEHAGWILGSRTRWSQDVTSEHEQYMREVRADEDPWKNKAAKDMPEVISPGELAEWTFKVWRGDFDFDD